MSEHVQHFVENTATKTGSAVAVVSGGSNFLLENAETFSVIGIISGIALAVAGVVFQFRRDKRESEFHNKRMNEQ